MSLARQRGFTLIETIMAGVISTVLAGAILTSFYLTSNSTKNGMEIIKASQKANLVSWQFRTLARQAFGIMVHGEALPGGSPDTNATTSHIISHFLFVGPPPRFDTLGGFRVYRDDNRLYEAYRGAGGAWDWKPFVIGDRDTVYIRPYEDSPLHSNFTPHPRRGGVEFQTAFRYNSTSYFPMQIERVLCRNQNRY